MLSDTTPSRSYVARAADFAGKNSYLLGTIGGIVQSVRMNFFGKETNPSLTFDYAISLIISTSLTAFFGFASSYSGIDSNISITRAKMNEHRDDPLFTAETIDNLRRELDEQEKDTRETCIRSSLIETGLILSLLLLIAYEHKNLNGASRFTLEAIFYVLQAFDYRYASTKLQQICDRSKENVSLFNQNTIDNHHAVVANSLEALINFHPRTTPRSGRVLPAPQALFQPEPQNQNLPDSAMTLPHLDQDQNSNLVLEEVRPPSPTSRS